MPAVNNVLVIGGGLAGTATAIQLTRHGVAVDLVEVKPDIAAIGSGITLQGNALRELRRLGVWERVSRAGFPYNNLGLRAPDRDGTLLVEFPDVRSGGPDLPATMGMPRPLLARILLDQAIATGVKTSFGVTVAGLEQDATGVEVTFTDGSAGRYDLVVGADGIRSATRRMLGISVDPRPVGMGIWRVFGPRPASVTRTDLYYGGPCYLAGYTPTGEDSLYAYVVEDSGDHSGLTPEQRLARVCELASAYHGPWDDIRSALTDPSRVNYTNFETHLLPAPWHRGRVVLIGDAAHSCPPTLAQGGAMALEDATVLAELLVEGDVLDDALWDAFTARRHARAAEVVAASNQIAQWLLDHEQGDIPGLVHRIGDLVSQPA
ncbi:FAD-dependent oxidoreductase [Lentzea aerocolonigenes]|uniref:FAD-dependent oxidoreductase n=1 Tax=Lentzea aerocolonigenes TaxID=68170 RepID=UPI0004C452A2|nr:FAD-dependent oxidoreductase [Lentzea aerocolonigenes]MCP2242637.1 2-polyprenyl-6-methoxyphenol hydroxylase [Lentzea aerocolonigenes]